MDAIVVAVIALLAGGYLFWRFRAAATGKTRVCGRGACGSSFSCSGSTCESNQGRNIPHDKPKRESGN